MKIVKFRDGTYAIRRWFFGYQYLDTKGCFLWRNIDHPYFKDCKLSLNICIDLISNGRDFGEIIDTNALVQG